MRFLRSEGLVLALVATATAGCNPGKHSAQAQEGLPPGATPATAPLPSESLRPPPPAPSGPELTHLASFAPIVHAADPAVVTITTVGEEVEVSPFTLRRRAMMTRGLGTGFVVDKNGIILTNNHVVQGARAIQVKLSDQRTFPGQIAGTDPVTDIAVVRINAKELHALPLGDSDAAEVGDWVLAIGNPFGLSHTVSAGIISAKGRTNQDVPLDPSGYYDFLQTDASINPGNSGGPLLNLREEVVGINSAIRGGGAQGIGFAIPINMVKQLLPMLLRDGHVTRSALGVKIIDLHELSPEDRQALGLTDGKLHGAVIAGVMQGGTADKAGLQAGDVIEAFDGTPIERSSQLQWLASTAGVGRTVALRVRRDGKTFDLNVTLSKLLQEQAPQQEGQQ